MVVGNGGVGVMDSSVDASYPHPTSPAVTKVMKANRKTGSKPEVRLRSALHRSGMRFRKNLELRLGSLRVRPDIVFTRAKVAVFVDGCFWHGCDAHGTQPHVNHGYWAAKLQRNRKRDQVVDTVLRDAGWTVLRVWEHDPVDGAVVALQEAMTGVTTPDSGRTE
jgi:DNA mismatch endonuclease (patch repair protein)